MTFNALHIQGGLDVNRHNITNRVHVLLDFSLTVKAAPHECEIRTSQP